jgi:hypothetical protein
VSVPGPVGAVWAVELLGAAALSAWTGEAVRGVAERWVPGWRTLHPIERLLLDFYLGGALLYLFAIGPFGLFGVPLIAALPLAATVLLGFRVGAVGARSAGRALRALLTRLARPAPLLALVATAVLFLVELAAAAPIGTGNTYDSSLLTLYTALLLHHGAVALSFAPYAPVSILYPQGTTVWLGWAQSIFGLPPARTSLLLTPLFLGIAPLGGWVVGQRWFGTDRAALALALGFAFLGPATRAQVAGSNDFVFAFPLGLLVLGSAAAWVRDRPVPVGDAVAFGVLLGYSAALNPVGAEWIALALPIAGLLARPRWGGRVRAWFGRWALAVALALGPIAPTLYVLAQGWASPGFVPGAGSAPAGLYPGISPAQFLGSIDPYLFRGNDIELSPIPLVRVELAILFTIGLALFLWVGRTSPLGRYLETGRTLIVAGVAAILLLLAVLVAAGAGVGPAERFAAIASGAELSLWIFTLYGILAAVPLALVLEMVARPHPAAPPDRPPRRRAWHRPGDAPAVAPAGAWVVALAIVVPGAALTPTALPVVLSSLYHDFGNVTGGDFALLEYAAGHLPSGARVLVAPGSAAEFLPGYCSNLVLLYPLVPGWPWINASYRLVVSELTNGTLSASGTAALAALDVQYIAVTENNTILWPAFEPGPLLADPSAYPLLFENGGAYLFERTG